MIATRDDLSKVMVQQALAPGTDARRTCRWIGVQQVIYNKSI